MFPVLTSLLWSLSSLLNRAQNLPGAQYLLWRPNPLTFLLPSVIVKNHENFLYFFKLNHPTFKHISTLTSWSNPVLTSYGTHKSTPVLIHPWLHTDFRKVGLWLYLIHFYSSSNYIVVTHRTEYNKIRVRLQLVRQLEFCKKSLEGKDHFTVRSIGLFF